MAKTINERFLDHQVAWQIRWIKLGNAETEKAVEILNRIDGQLAALLANSGLDGTPYTKARAEALRGQVAAIVNSIHDDFVAPELLDMIKDVSELAARVEGEAFEEIMPVGLDITTPNLGVLQQAATLNPFNGAIMADWVSQLKKSDLDRTWQTILDGIISGVTTDDLIRSLTGTKALGYKDGVRQVTRRGMEALVRTSINHAANQGRQMFWEANEGLLKGVRWVSTLDTKTTPICQHRDGRVGPVSPDPNWTPPPGSEALDPPMARPPAHPNCRSTTVGITKSWRELGFDIDELPEGTRASMNGQVPANLTYYDWLARQSDEVIEEVLGPERFAMWKSGEIDSFRKFYNDVGQKYTIDDLRSMVKTPPAPVKPPKVRLTDFYEGDNTLSLFDWKQGKNLENYFDELEPTDFGLAAWPRVALLPSLKNPEVTAKIERVIVLASRDSEDTFAIARARFDLKDALWRTKGNDQEPLHAAPEPLKIADAFDLTDFTTAGNTAKKITHLNQLPYLDPKEFGIKEWPDQGTLAALAPSDIAKLFSSMRMVIINNAPTGKPKIYQTMVAKQIDKILNPPAPAVIKNALKDMDGNDIAVLSKKQFSDNEKVLGNSNAGFIRERYDDYVAAIEAFRVGQPLTKAQHGAYMRSRGMANPADIAAEYRKYQDSAAFRVKTSRDNSQPPPFAVAEGEDLLETNPQAKSRMQKAYEVMPNWVLNEIADVTVPKVRRGVRAHYSPWDGTLQLDVSSGVDVWVHEMFHSLDFKYRYRGEPVNKRNPWAKNESLNWNTDDDNLNRLSAAVRAEFKRRDNRGVGVFTHNKDGEYWLGDWQENYEGRKYEFDLETSSEYITMGAQRYIAAKMHGDYEFRVMREKMQEKQPAMLELLDYIWTRFD